MVSEQNLVYSDQLSTILIPILILMQTGSIIKIYYNIFWGHAVAQWLRHYATRRKIAGARPDEVIFFNLALILPAALGPGFHSASNRNEYQKQ
jgi:hypothetical protein